MMKKIILLFTLAIIGCSSLQAKDALEEYIATYKFYGGTLFKEVTIILQNGNLSLSSAKGNVALQKNGIDRFIIPAYNGKATFIRNRFNEITGIKIEALGQIVNGSIEKNKAVKTNTTTKPPMPSKVLLSKWFDQPDDLYAY